MVSGGGLGLGASDGQRAFLLVGSRARVGQTRVGPGSSCPNCTLLASGAYCELPPREAGRAVVDSTPIFVELAGRMGLAVWTVAGMAEAAEAIESRQVHSTEKAHMRESVNLRSITGFKAEGELDPPDAHLDKLGPHGRVGE